MSAERKGNSHGQGALNWQVCVGMESRYLNRQQ